MNQIIILSILTTFLFAQNPRVYSAIGDDIYNNIDAIENLKLLSSYPYEEKKINSYISNVKENKEMGFKIESGDKDVKASIYLNKLRELSKINDSFKRKIKLNFDKSLKDENPLLFLEMVNSGLLDTKNRKKVIMNFYYKHKEIIKPTGVIKIFLDEDIKFKKQQEYLLKAKKREEADRIKYLREKDKAEEEALNRRLTQELIRKKEEIRKHQKEELNIH